MSISYNPLTNTRDLLFYVDPANTKSYPGTGTSISNIINNTTCTMSSSIIGTTIDSGIVVTSPSTAILNTDLHSIFFMIRFNTTVAYGSNGYSGNWNKIFSFNAGGSDRTPSVWRWPGERTLHWRYDPGNTGCDFGKSAAGTGNQFDIDTWYYVGVTKNNSSTVMYVNGIQVGTGSVAYPKTGGSSSIILFESYPSGLATLGPVQIYTSPIDSAQVFQNFSAIRGRYNI